MKGVIEGEDGTPLDGASIMVKGSNKGAITDKMGEFTLDNVPSGAVLEITYSGYQRKEVPLNGKNSFQIKMAIASGALDQVQVIAYGTTSPTIQYWGRRVL